MVGGSNGGSDGGNTGGGGGKGDGGSDGGRRGEGGGDLGGGDGGGGKGGGCGCDSITHTGSDHELSRQSIYESISYHDTISGRRRMGGLLLLSSRTSPGETGVWALNL